MLVNARATQDDDYLLLEKPKAWARAIRRDVVAVWIAARDPRVPWYAKALALYRDEIGGWTAAERRWILGGTAQKLWSFA